MKKILSFVFIISSLLIASNQKDVNKTKQNMLKTQIEKQIQREKKYAREQTFYQGSDYDLKGAEVNPDSLSTLPDLEDDYEFDMDSVYD